VNLPANFTVTSLRNKVEELAGALGRDVTMVDIRKAAHANQAAIWLSSRDPFEVPRPSPLLTGTAAVDAWRYGIAVAWNKRGEHILLPITNSNILIAGMTRSGKGVGAANLTVGASLDVRINLRVVPGKMNGEWDAYARAGVASTYFKPDPKRLLALLEALKADKNRREAILGKLGKSKMTVDTIEKLGGIELLIIDELATYTRPGKPLRDEILEALIELSAVAAGAGILMVLITQYPETDVIPQARWR
jgi:S-DNA-T family DNA segregation ATPase FtsK/SpoIIIE